MVVKETDKLNQKSPDWYEIDREFKLFKKILI